MVQLIIILILIIFVIAIVRVIVLAILHVFLTFLFLLSTNALLFIEKCFYISNAIPPWVSWGIFGLFIGLLLAAYKSASHHRYRYLRPFFIVLPILVLVGLGSYNANRLRRPLGEITQSGYQKASQPKQHSFTKTDSQKSMPDQSKNQDNYKPETAIPAPQSTVSKVETSDKQIRKKPKETPQEILSEEEVETLIEKWIRLQNVSETMQLYADKVDYYDYGLVDKAFVEKFLASEVKARSYRKDKLTSSIKIIPGNIDNEKTAKFTGHFIYGNDKTTIEGDYNSEITLRKQKDHIVIVREKGKIENQQTKDTPVPKVAIPAQQFSLTDALRKRPWVVINTRERFDHRSARMEFMNNGVIIVYTDEYPRNRGFFRMSLNFSWSPSESAYIGTWGNSYNNVCGRIKLWPQYDSHGNIKCFSGYMGNGSGSHDAIIKVKNFFCRCRDPIA